MDAKIILSSLTAAGRSIGRLVLVYEQKYPKKSQSLNRKEIASKMIKARQITLLLDPLDRIIHCRKHKVSSIKDMNSKYSKFYHC